MSVVKAERYVAYKDSEIDWLGEVPSIWRTVRLKDIIEKLESGVSVNASAESVLDDKIGVLKTSCVGKGEFLPSENKSVWLNELDRVRVPVRKGRIIISRMNTPQLVGASAYVKKNYPNLFLPDRLWQTVFYRSVKISSKWLSFLLGSSDFRYLLSIAATGTSPSMKNLGQEKFLNINIPFPPPQEQTAIAAYLDRKTGQIDRKIDLLNQKATQYGKLKQSLINETVTRGLDKTVLMKESGIEWLGEIPSNWSITRNKDIFYERGSLSQSGDETLLTVSHITGVTRRSEKNVNMFMAETMEGYKRCKTGDLIINTMWAWMGALGTAREDGICSPAYGVYAPIKSVPYSHGYFDYLYRTPKAVSEMTRHSKGIVSSRLRLYPKDFFQILTALPSYKEQTAIVNYLDTKTTQIDRIITTINTQIDKLKELRKALINDVVTGKIKMASEELAV